MKAKSDDFKTAQGVSGAGKSTLCRKLVAAISDATLFEFDKYEEVPGVVPTMDVWLESNFDPEHINLTQALEDFTSLINGNVIQYPLNGGVAQPGNVIIFDTPIGRAHSGFAPLIDLSILIDLPYEVALARRIQRIIKLAHDETAAIKRPDTFIPFYLHLGRLMYIRHKELVEATADTTLDGVASSKA